ncbi:MAG: 1-deoxy-D-xylulose-5-phosphate reductoisomerase [Phycisphaerales bacterium]|nr:1-deoxy-D-xylulose-5-phosphate reductoisomerase [Phycisphaerales bacterium]
MSPIVREFGRPPEVRRLLLLGSTGSVGAQTVDVVRHLNALHARGEWPTRYEVTGLAAGRNGGAMLEQARLLGVREAALTGGENGFDDAAREAGVNLRTGPDACERLVREVEADLVLAAVVGAAGLPATLAAVSMGRDVALANKETLVAAGALVVPAAERSGARLLPVDSEHSAIWQCLPWGEAPPLSLGADVSRVTLTASGGPFRTWSAERVMHATVEEALNHPTWKMGAKVTIDSASLTNKGLELIEAHWLFGLGSDRLDAVVHPQSIIHSFVEYSDGSIMAQLGAPDMRTPIQIAASWPWRGPGRSKKLDLLTMSRLDFEPVDPERFPAVGVAFEVIDAMARPGGATAGAVFNAANEAAVEAFLAGRIPFGRITRLAREALDGVGLGPMQSLDDALEADREARRFVAARIDGARSAALR